MAWSPIQPRKQDDKKNSGKGVGGGRKVCVRGEEGGQNLKKREGGNIGVFSWNRRVSTPLPTMLKKFPPIIKPSPPHSWLNPISSKNFPSPPPPPHCNHFGKSDLPPPLYEGGRFGLCIIFKIKKTHCVK